MPFHTRIQQKLFVLSNVLEAMAGLQPGKLPTGGLVGGNQKLRRQEQLQPKATLAKVLMVP